MPAIGAVRPTAIICWTKVRRDSRPLLTSAMSCRSSRSFISSAPGWCSILNRPLDGPAVTKGLAQLEMDQDRTILSKQDPGQCRAAECVAVRQSVHGGGCRLLSDTITLACCVTLP